MVIMIKTRGLGRALGRVIGRALGRQDHHHADNEAACIAEDVLEMTEDILAPGAEASDIVEGLADDGTEGLPGDDVEGFPGGPHDPSVLTSFADHVAHSIWNGEERPELKLASHGKKVEKFGRPAPKIEGLVAAIGLTPLIACLVDTGDLGVISAFVERWHKETSSFHLPVEELAITLDDVASLLHLPIISAFHSFEPLHVDEAVIMLMELVEVSNEKARAETAQCHGAYSGSYAWGAAALVHMYDQLNDASKSTGRQLAGYITLLQCWIYKHFPNVHESMTDERYDETSQRAYRWLTMKAYMKELTASSYRTRIDALMIPDVCWMPYGDHRRVRAFDLISCFQGELR
ncbi:Protein MAIN-LIKE 1 [Glycine soja]